MGPVNNSVENHGNNSGFWVGINQGQIHLASAEKLPIAEGAAYDAYENEQLGCLPGTRTEILDSIQQWARSASRECIFWLNGGAGTGKSSIAFEAARALDEANCWEPAFSSKEVEVIVGTQSDSSPL